MASSGRKGLFESVRNWAVKKKLKEEMVKAARRLRGPGRGADYPLTDTEDPERVALFVKCLEEIVAEHQEMTVIVSPKHLTLGYKSDMAAAMGKEIRESLENAGLIAKPGQELPVTPQIVDGTGDPIDLYTDEEIDALYPPEEAADHKARRRTVEAERQQSQKRRL